VTPSLGILCYHRIVNDDDNSLWPYRERGTAVRRRTFERHMAELSRFADIVDEGMALDILSRRRRIERASVWMTFDDGYGDVADVFPLVETATVFVTTCTSTRLLPADAWYAVLLAARRGRGTLDLGHGSFDYDLWTPWGRARLVHGPERRAFLRANENAQSSMLEKLARELDANATTERPYLTESELRTLVQGGWSVGSHGVTHTPFDALDAELVRQEAANSRETLRSLGSVRSLSLPDGTNRHAHAVLGEGFECVLGLGDAVTVPGLDVQPRFLVPDDPTFVTRVLKPALTGGANA